LGHYLDFENAVALDLFAGTGSITLELLSRGCPEVVCVELDRDHHRFIMECLNKLSPAPEFVHKATANTPQQPDAALPTTPQANPVGRILPLRADVFRFIKSCRQQFDLIFADPPYALKELATLPDLIFEKGLLKEDGLFILEHGKDYDFSKHPHFVEHRQYGSVNFSLFKNL
jgi:16S rRNA G966 N2-methylase RsmD